MVVFTCNHCGESLHKPKVEKHYQFTCRNYKSVSCVDCFKDFRDEEYVVHTKCITEDERYAAKGTYKNGIVKKGDVKQESWLEMIKSICDTEKNLKPSIRSLLNTISEYSNVPRKKPKFMNFIRSSSGNRANMKDVEEVWDIIEKYKAKNAPNNQKNTQKNAETQSEQQIETVESEQPSKKRSIADNENNEEESPKKKKKKSSKEITQESGKDQEDNENNEEESPKKKKKKSSKEITQENGEGTTEKHNGVNKKPKLEPFQGTKEVFTEENENVTENLKKKKKKLKNDDSIPESTADEAVSSETVQEASAFNFKDKLLEILSEKKTISQKKLQKKILKAYMSATGESDCEEKVIKKINKKLKKIPNVGIEDDRVILK